MQTILSVAEPFDKLLKKQKVKTVEQYRPMNFVVEQPVKEGLLLYHTMTKALVLLTPEEAELYKTVPTSLPDLISEWFLVPLTHDDRLLSRQMRDVARMLKKHSKAITTYTILTTTDCNARCFYCYEMGRPRVPMTADIAWQTADYIIRHCEKKKVTLAWFGGEPLYNKPVITLICQQLKDAGIKFSSRMVSNGYLFDDDTIQEARQLWLLKRIQITLDGTEKIYNRSKAYIYKNVNAYQRVIGNIHKLQESGIHVTIRLNIGLHNSDDLMELAHELHHEFPDTKGVEVYIHPLFEEEKGQSTHHDDAREELYHKLWDISERLEDYGLLQKSTLKHLVKTSRCIADNDNCLIVTPGGKLGKCEHYSEDHFVGHINNDNFDQNVIGDFKALHEEIEACKTCFYYPNCIWLNLCPNDKNCYPEIREDKIRKVRRGILTIYKNFKKQA